MVHCQVLVHSLYSHQLMQHLMLYQPEQLALLNDIPTLTDILMHHVLGDSVMSTMLSNGMMATTLLGTDVTVLSQMVMFILITLW